MSRQRPTAAYEYYNADTDQYFLTISRPEIDALESGRITGWKRTGTGEAFMAFDVATIARGSWSLAGGHASRVPLLHSADVAFPLGLRGRMRGGGGRRTRNSCSRPKAAFHAWLPDATGPCPRLFAKIGGFEFQPVYRLWDSHRRASSIG